MWIFWAACQFSMVKTVRIKLEKDPAPSHDTVGVKIEGSPHTVGVKLEGSPDTVCVKVEEDDTPPTPRFAISVHSAGVSTEAVHEDISKMQDILSKRFESRQCAASSAIVLLQDGLYIPWKRQSTTYNLLQLVKWNWFHGMNLRYTCHGQKWTTAGPGSTYVDAERANSGRPDVPGPPTPLITSRWSPGCEPLMPSSASSAPDVSQAVRPRPMLTLDLIGHVGNPSQDQALRVRAHAMRYDRVHQALSSGSFGDVYSCHSTVGLRAVKKLMTPSTGDRQELQSRTHCDVALVEVDILERCARCPHIITLLDVCKSGPRICLIFEVWGTSLYDLQRAKTGFGTACHLRMAFEQSLKALTFLHSLDVIHTDIKSPNMLVQWNTDAPSLTCESTSLFENLPLHLKLAGFGTCLVADPRRRSHINAITRSFRHEMRHITTFHIALLKSSFATSVSAPPLTCGRWAS